MKIQIQGSPALGSSWTSRSTMIFLTYWSRRKKYSAIQLEQERPPSNILAVINSEFAQALRSQDSGIVIKTATCVILSVSAELSYRSDRMVSADAGRRCSGGFLKSEGP